MTTTGEPRLEDEVDDEYTDCNDALLLLDRLAMMDEDMSTLSSFLVPNRDTDGNIAASMVAVVEDNTGVW